MNTILAMSYPRRVIWTIAFLLAAQFTGVYLGTYYAEWAANLILIGSALAMLCLWTAIVFAEEKARRNEKPAAR